MIDVVVVGSGYGGSAVAARLAGRARVLLVERGRRWAPERLPRTVFDLVRAYRARGRPTGLWEMRLGRGTGNACATGLGGGSLVNYGISARPEDSVFDEWPIDAPAMEPYYERALARLRPSVSPSAATLGDREFLDRVEPGLREDVACTIDWSRCDECGRCVPGCPTRAKRTLEQTCVDPAIGAGLEVRLETEVVGLAPHDDGGWELSLRRKGTFEALRSRGVVLAGGVFGTLDLLSRVRRRVPVSPALGRGMSMNGDAVAFLYDLPIPMGAHRGAPITTSVRLPFVDGTGRARTATVISGRLPAAIRRFVGAALAVSAGSAGETLEAPASPFGRLRDLLEIGEGGAISRSFMAKFNTQDSCRGEAAFDRDGRSAIDWADYGEDPILRFAAARVREWGRAVGAVFLDDPGRWPGMRNFGVHPLGGCRMSRRVEDGVVDPRGRVFRPDGGFHPTLWIADASIVPAALGVPPSLTVAALGERVADDVANALGVPS